MEQRRFTEADSIGDLLQPHAAETAAREPLLSDLKNLVSGTHRFHVENSG